MSSLENKYKLNQDDKEYILSTSDENNCFKLSCQDSANRNSLVFLKIYTLEDLKQYNIFASVSSIEEAIDHFDKLLSSEKVSIIEQSPNLIINLFTSNDKIEFVLTADAGMGYESRNNDVQLNSVPSEQVFSSHVSPELVYSQYKNEDTTENYQAVPDIQQPIFTMTGSRNQNINEISHNVNQNQNIEQNLNEINQNQNLNQNFTDTNQNQNYIQTTYVKNQEIPIGQFFTQQTISGVVDAQTYNQFLEKFTNGTVVNQPIVVNPPTTTSYELPVVTEKKTQIEINTNLPNDIKSQIDNYNTYVNQVNEENNNKVQQYQLKKIENQQEEINSLKAENENMKMQLRELDTLKKRVAELEYFKERLSELDSIRQTVNELYSLKNNVLRTQNKREVIEREVIHNRPVEDNKLIFENVIQQIPVKGDIIRNSAELEMLSRKMSKNSNKICLNLIYISLFILYS